ncbi:hypothetical protein TKK_0011875 [Trichogramma kaykai]
METTLPMTCTHLISTDKRLSTMTGLDSFKLLDSLICLTVLYKFFSSVTLNVIARRNTNSEDHDTSATCWDDYFYNGGRASDLSIFNQSNFIKDCQPKDGIMVDRGFLIDGPYETNQIHCCRPPFLKQSAQFSQTGTVNGNKIACARVHVERANQRIKRFQALGGTMPSCLLPLVDDIYTVVCVIVNLSSPILSDDKFVNNDKS